MADNRGTPISQLRGEGGNNSEVVSSILHEMESGGGIENVPSQQQQQQQQNHMQQQQHMRSPQQQEHYREQYYEDDDDDDDRNNNMQVQYKQRSFGEQIVMESKLPILVIILVFLSNIQQLNKLLVQYVPRVVGGDGNLNMLGLFAKALLAGIIFYIVKRFVLNTF